MYKVHVINSLIAPKGITHNLYSAAVIIAPLSQKLQTGLYLNQEKNKE